jgi:hypothetical protein
MIVYVTFLLWILQEVFGDEKSLQTYAVGWFC